MSSDLPHDPRNRGDDAPHPGEEARDAAFARELLSRAPRPTCPEPVVARIWSSAGDTLEPPARPTDAAAGPAPGSRVWARLVEWLGGSMWRPALAGAAVLAVLLGGAELRHRTLAQRTPLAGVTLPDSMSAEEALAVTAEVRLALSIVAQAMSRTAHHTEQEIRNGVRIPVVRGVGRGIDAFPPPFQSREKTPRDHGTNDPVQGLRGRA